MLVARSARSAVSVVVVVSALVVVAGCPAGDVGEGEGDVGGEGEGDVGEGEGDVGEGEGEGDVGEGEGEGEGEGDIGEGEGEGEGPPPVPSPCLTALPLNNGDVVDGSTVGARSGARLCDDENGAGPDVAYRFVLDEDKGVVVRASSDEVAVFVTVYADDACSEDTGDDICVEGNASGDAIVDIGSLAAGAYFVVVDTDNAGAFSLSLTVSDEFCDGDTLDPDDDEFAGAVFVGHDDAALTRELCLADHDWILLEHLGGALAVDVSGAEASVFAADVDVAASRALGELVYDVGDPVVVVVGADVAAAAYLVDVSVAGDPGVDGAVANIDIAHGCHGDVVDRGIAALDADAEAAQQPQLVPVAPVQRVLCGDDVDLAVVDVVFPGRITFTLDSTTPLSTGLFTLSDDGALTPLTSTDTVVGNRRTLSADVGEQRVAVRVESDATSDATFSWSFALDSLADAPDNDVCAGAVVLEGGDVVIGRTAGATDDGTGSCTGDGAGGAGGAGGDGAEVFFRFRLDVDSGVALDVQALSPESTLPVVSIHPLEGDACPANLDELSSSVLVIDDFGEPVQLCIADSQTRRLNVLPAGDYLVVAEDQFTDGGVFSVGLDVVAGGFPRACDHEDRVVLPASGAPPLVLTLAGDTFFLDNISIPAITSRGDERAFRFTAPAAGTVTVRTREEAAAVDSDTVIAVREGDCDVGDVIAKNDDDDEFDGEFDSVVTADVEAFVDYVIVVDHFFRDDPADSDVVEVEVLFD